MNKMIALFCAAVIAVSSSSAIVMAEDAENSGTQTVNEVSDNTADNTDTEENTDSEADGDTEDDTDASDENDSDTEDNTDASDKNDADTEDNTGAADKNDADSDENTDTAEKKESDADDASRETAETAAPDADEAVSATDAPEEKDQPSATDAPAEDASSATAAPAASTVRSSGGGGGGSAIAVIAEPTATADPTATAEPAATPEPTATTEPTATADPTATTEPTATEKPEKDTEKTTTQTTVVMKKPFTLVKKYEDNPFDDCQSGWFKNYVSFAYANGIIKGYSDNTFDPFGKITGSQLAVMLYRISTGKADMVTEGDVWSDEAMAWVKANGIMADFADDDFNANEILTREEIICSLYRSYSLYNKAEEGGTIDKDRFPDAGKVSEFALPAMKWAVASKIITGKGDKWIDPLSNVTRAETATIFERYLENLEFADVPVEVKPTSATEKKTDESTAEAAEDKTEASAAEAAEEKTEASDAVAAEVKTDAAEAAVEPEAPVAEAEAPADAEAPAEVEAPAEAETPAETTETE